MIEFYDELEALIKKAKLRDRARAVTDERSPTATELMDEWEEHDRKVALRSANKPTVDINEDLYNVCESHDFDCKCQGCTDLNLIGQQLMDRKRRFKYDADEAPGTGYKEATKKVKETQAGNPLGGTEVGEDDKFLDVIEALQKRIGGDAKVSVVGHNESGVLFGVEGDVDELPPGEELRDIIKTLRPRGPRRESPMDRGLPEDVSALERFETRYHELSHRFQLGYINTRDLRELISDAFTELMESLEKVSKGQTGLAV